MAKGLRLEKYVEGGCLILKAAGEFTELDCGALVSATRQGLAPGVRRTILDVSGVTFMSSVILGELAAERHRLAGSGCELVLVCGDSKVRSLLLLSGLDKVVPSLESIEEALRVNREAGGGSIAQEERDGDQGPAAGQAGSSGLLGLRAGR
jgi:anti-sigma B factor antagonist